MQPSAPIDLQQILTVIQEGERTAGPKITIFFSVPHVSDFAIVGQAELKAFAQEAELLLKNRRVPEHQLAAIKKELNAIMMDASIWQHRSNSYAVFITPQFAQVHAFPIDLPRGVWVGDRFHLTPLVPLFSLPDHFLVVEVSLGAPRLIRLHPTFATEIELDEVAKYVLAHDDAEPITNRAFHTSRMSKSTGDRGIVVPHGSHQDEIWREEERYLKVLASTVDKKIHGERAYLIITGTPEIASRFEKLINYPRVLLSHKHVRLVEHMESIDMLWRECLDLFHEASRSSDKEALSEYEAKTAKGLAVTGLQRIVELAHGGGIESLLIEQKNGVSNSDLIDAALSGTLLHKGRVVAVEKLPTHSDSGVAAILRPAWRESVSTIG